MSQETDTKTAKKSETDERCVSEFKECGTAEDSRPYSEHDSSVEHSRSHQAQERGEYREQKNEKVDRERPHEEHKNKAQKGHRKKRRDEHKKDYPENPDNRQVIGSTSTVASPRTAVRGSSTADGGPRTSSARKTRQEGDTETYLSVPAPGSVDEAISTGKPVPEKPAREADDHSSEIKGGNVNENKANPYPQSGVKENDQMASRHCKDASSKKRRSVQGKGLATTEEGYHGQYSGRFGGMNRRRKFCASDEYLGKSVGSRTRSHPKMSPGKESSKSRANSPAKQSTSGRSSKLSEDGTSNAAASDKPGRQQRRRRGERKTNQTTDHTSTTVINLDNNSTTEISKSVVIPSAAEAKGAPHKTLPNTPRGSRRKNVRTSKTETVQKETEANDKPEDILQKKTDNSSTSRCPATLHKKSAAKETKLYIRVHDVIRDRDKLKELLTSTAGVDVNPGQARVTGKYTSCTVTCPSRNQAWKLQDLLVKDRLRFTPLVECSSSEFKKKDDQHTSLQKRSAALVEQEFDRRARALIKSNTDKCKVHERSLKLAQKRSGAFFTHEEVKAEVEAIEEKLKELEMQTAEFTASLKIFKEKLSRAPCEKEIQEIRKKFDIEASRFGKALPIYARRKDIVEMVREKQVCIVLGETGSGKSTQLVQYLIESGVVYGSIPSLKTHPGGTIVCAQPRKVAALSLSKHVAREMGTKIGQLVGYKVGNNIKCSQATKILFMTDHTLLNECMRDPLLQAFSCIIVDEAHERSLYTDLLLAMIKRLLPRRPDLRVIITSATIDPTVFQDFFSTCCPNCPIMRVSGRAFPVDVKWQEELSEEFLTENYTEEAVKKVIDIHCKEPQGGILVFLTSPAETERCSKNLQDRMGVRGDYRCFQLHGQQQADEQQKVFEPIETNKRKIVFATNCAETSITIDGIRYVVDTGLAKEMRYDPKRNMNSLSLTIVSKSSSDQRKGRAGRTAPGVCYRLYSESTFKAMDNDSLPEILRSHLGHALLKLAELGVERDMYDFVQSPSAEAIDEALRSLERVGALQDGRITETGRRMAKLPLDPQLGLLILLGIDHNLLYDSIVLAAIISTGAGVFYRGATAEEQLRLTKKKMEKFCHAGGDSLTALSVYKEWLDIPEKGKNQWCTENCLNAKTLRGIRDAVNEVIAVLQREDKINIVQTFSDADTTDEVLRKLIFRCYCHSVCHFLGTQSAGYLAVGASRRVHHHPSSILRDLALNPQWVVYTQLIRTSRDFITGITPVEESWLSECKRELGFDIEEVRKKTVTKVHTVTAGPHVFFTIVGPQYTRLRRLEEEACSGPVDIILEASRESGTVTLWTTENPADENVQQLVCNLKDIVRTTTEQLEKEDMEIPVAGDKKYGVRVVLGQGAKVMEILTPDLTRKVYICRPSLNATEETVLAKFRQYGEITFHRQFTEGRNWGFLIFATSKQALQAAQRTNVDCHESGWLEHRSPLCEETEGKFRIRLVWCERPSMGVAFVSIADPFRDYALQLKSFYVEDEEVSIKADEYTADLVLRGVTSFMTEINLRRALLQTLLAHLDERGEESEIVRNICIARVMDPQTLSSSDIDAEMLHLLQLNGLYTQYWLKINRSNDQDNPIFGRADVLFRDVVRGSRAAESLRHAEFRVRGKRVYVIPIASVQTFIPINIWKICRHEVMEVVEDIERDGEVFVNVSEPRITHKSGPREKSINPEDPMPEEEGTHTDDAHREDDAPNQAEVEREDKGATTNNNVQRADEEENEAVPQASEMNQSAGHRVGATYPQTVAVFYQADETAYPNADATRQEADIDDEQERGDYEFEELSEVEERDPVYTKESTHVILTFEAETMDVAMRARSYMDEVIKGEVVDCKHMPNISYLMSHAGRAFLKKAERETGGTVILDARFCTVAIHGTQEARRQVRQKLEMYTALKRTTEEMSLKGDDKPPGVMKALITRYGIDLDGFLEAAELQDVSLDFRRHQLKMTGLPDSLDKARQLVLQEIDSIWETTLHRRPENKETVTCSVCLSEVSGRELCRLELCAHPYCRGCLKAQVAVSVKNKSNIPVICCHEYCEKPLAWRDFRNMARRWDVLPVELAKASVFVFARENQNVARFCPTADCPAVYNVSDVVFVCPDCRKATCTVCHKESHPGKRCELQQKVIDVDQDVKAWFNENPRERNTCPSCKYGIEKWIGCDHVHCTNCNTHFCWLCRKVYETERACYRHIPYCTSRHFR